MIAIIDYDAGNLKSVEKALNYVGKEAIITRDRDTLLKADHVILPGVGNFGDAMDKLYSFGLDRIIKEVCNEKIPFLGICLGLQLLFDSSEECPGKEGLGILPGKIIRIPDEPGLKIPHIGWNDIEIRPNARLFKDVPNHSYVYFVHSYYLQAKDPSIVAATTNYSCNIHASVERDNVFACQFHPEKSGTVGLQIIKNFAAISKEDL